MGLEKYEIITVGSDKRVRALRSWQVGDRYVNIGDVGGIVYDEKTLSQDGACWLFRGNFNFPGARIGGDSIVDVGEAVPNPNGSANLDILGSSAVVGAPVNFRITSGAVDGVTLSAADFEQGVLSYVRGTSWETWKSASPNHLRTKAPIFMGGVSKTLKLDVPGYTIQAFVLDRDGNGINATVPTNTGEGVTLAVPVGQYMLIQMLKNPAAGIVPADATAAQIKFTAVYEAKLVVVDSRLELNPANGTGAISIFPGGHYSLTPGAKYLDTVIQGSKVVINSHASTARRIDMLTELVNVNATIDATTADAQAVGIHHGVYNLAFKGLVSSNLSEAGRSLIQAYNCDNMVVSPTIFPGLGEAQTANMPFIFQGCNVPGGKFYHHAQIANTYKNVDFAKAQADLGKTVGRIAGRILVSSEIEGMYRIFAGTTSYGALVESYDSVKSLTLPDVTGSISESYGTTIYKDAYLNGLLGIAGTNVFGNTKKHEASNTQVMDTMLYQGKLTSTVGGVPSLVEATSRVSTIVPFRINGPNGILVDNIPAGIDVAFLVCDAQGKYVVISTWKSSPAVVTNFAQLQNAMAYITFKKTDDASILLDEVKGVTVTTYNGCKIVNTGETAIPMKGNIRVEDNATLINASVTGSGYFGGNAVMSGMSVNGYAYMKDNTLCTKTSENVQTFAGLVMEGNAVYNSIASLALTGFKVFMYDNSKVLGELRSASPTLVMRDNATITAAGNLSGAGTVTIKDNAVINTSISTVGDITLCGGYVSTTVKTWTGKRVIDNHNAPGYDNNCKTQYDF